MDKLDMSRVCRSDISISLSEKESALFSILLQANKELNLNSTLRVAGGWVRDKILGMHSHDIDITIDNMTGYQFVEHLPQWLTTRGYEISNVGVIRANPEKSKHLETATIRIMGSDIDFVNLRKEEYDDSSRIPSISIGTPLEDAYRRDLTINSLFYNINTGTIEDYTMKGIHDLQERIVRTPLPALETFREDPLRVLRTVRFATRYECAIQQDIIEAAKDPDIEHFLSIKVSRERIGVEFLKMAQFHHFDRALHLLESMNILNGLFNIEGDNSFYMKKQVRRTVDEFNQQLFLCSLAKSDIDSLATLDAKYMNAFFSTNKLDIEHFRIEEPNVVSDQYTHRYAPFIQSRVSRGVEIVDFCERLMNTSAVQELWKAYNLYDLVLPIEDGWEAVMRLSCLFHAFTYTFLCGKVEVVNRKQYSLQSVVFTPLVKHFLRESLKLRNSMINGVCWVVHRYHELIPILKKCENPQYQPTDEETVELGSLMLSSKELWPLMLHLAVIDRLQYTQNKAGEHLAMQSYARFLQIVKQKELMRMWEIPSIINGNELSSLGVPKGPSMKNVMEDIRKWMILNPHGTKEECIEAVIHKQE